MSSTSLIGAAQSGALRQEIEQQAQDESRILLADAERDSEALIARAYTNARRRLRETIAELRREGAHRIARAKAQAETEASRRAQRDAAAVIDRAWPFVAEALAARWRDPSARTAWITATVRQARERMHGKDWTVEHPTDWNGDEARQFREALDFNGAAVAFSADPNITAGIRIRAARATLDATPAGLLADHHTIAALLLAQIAQPNGGGAPDGMRT